MTSQFHQLVTSNNKTCLDFTTHHHFLLREQTQLLNLKNINCSIPVLLHETAQNLKTLFVQDKRIAKKIEKNFQ